MFKRLRNRIRTPYLLRKKEFVSTWKTDNAGVSNSTSITLPLVPGTHDFWVNWGKDGKRDHITAYDQAEVTHDYGVAGTYTPRITGTIIGWRFNNGGDKLKITNISRWGCLRLVNEGSYFTGCENMRVTATDTLNTYGIINFSSMFFSCKLLNRNICASNFSSGTNFANFQQDAQTFNQPVCYRLPSATSIEGFFAGNTLFNQSLDDMYIPLITSFDWLLSNCPAFDQSLAGVIIQNITTMINLLLASRLSVANFSSTLIAWQAQPHQPNVSVNFGGSKIIEGSPAEDAMDLLIGDDGWTILYGGYA